MSATPAIVDDRDEAGQHYALGRMHKARGEAALAEHSYREALRLRPGYVSAWISLGVLLRSLNRHVEAEACQREALRWEPENFQAALGLGNALLSQSRSADAAEVLRRAVSLNPTSPKAHLSLGWALLDLAAHAEAADCFINALRLDLSSSAAPDRFADSLSRVESPEAALALLSTATQVRPEAIGLWLAVAGGHAAAGHFDSAKALYEKALARMPAETDIRFPYSLLLLRYGDFERGWKYYESRLAGDDGNEGIALRQALGRPRWRGEPLAGRTLFVVREQGIGDQMMFASLFAEAIRDAGHCIVDCDERLEPLFRRSFPQATIVSATRRRPFDCWIAAGSLPGIYRNSAGQFPAHSGYLIADATRTARWRERLAQLGPGLKIGMSWRGGRAGSAKAARRSLALSQLRPVLNAAGAHFVSLQYGDYQEEIAAANAELNVPIQHWQEAIDDYEETAALIAELDLVITVCTAVVHLGGSLGQRVWVMAPMLAAAAYGWSGSSMVWYPQVRMFRQQAPDQWDAVIAQVAQALREALTAPKPL